MPTTAQVAEADGEELAGEADTESAASALYQGQRYVVTPDNSTILDVAPVSAGAAVCTVDSPCLYDDLPAGADPYAVSGGSWPVTGLTYSFANSSPDISGAAERGIIGQAFGLWSNVTRVKPSEVADGGGVVCGEYPDLVGRRGPRGWLSL